MSARRLLTYIYVDTSGSMRGEPIESVNVGLRALLASLRQNPYALESVNLSVVTFDSHISEVLPITPLEDVSMPEIACPDSGATLLGAALEHLCEQVARDVRLSNADQKGDWRPLLFILTDGKPSDTLAYSEVIARVKRCNFATIIACAAGPKADPAPLLRLTDKVVSLDTMDAASFSSFFQWLSATVTSGSMSMGAVGPMELPAPPPEVHIAI